MHGHKKTLLALQKDWFKPCPPHDQSDPVSAEPIVKKQFCCKTMLAYEFLDVSSHVADYYPRSSPAPAAFSTQSAISIPVGGSAAIHPGTTPFADYRYPDASNGALLTSLCIWLI